LTGKRFAAGDIWRMTLRRGKIAPHQEAVHPGSAQAVGKHAVDPAGGVLCNVKSS
jgi:hypothetical protein